MNELDGSMAEVSSSEPRSDTQMSAGAMLRRAREEAGLHIGALAVSLKVPVKKLEALEADRLDLLPDTVFARALAGTVCRILKIDAAPVLAAFPQTKAQRDGAQHTVNPPTFRPSGHSAQKSLAQKLSRPLILLGFAFALGTLVLVFFPAIQQLIEDVRRGAESSGVPAVKSTTAQSEVGKSPATIQATPESVPSNVKIGSAAGQDDSTPNAVSAPSPAATVAVNAGSPLSTASAPMEPAGILVLTARGNSWVEVTDAKREVVVRKTMVTGESQNLGGSLPLTIVLGRANLLDVQVRGKALDLAPLTKDNVARFEVK